MLARPLFRYFPAKSALILGVWARATLGALRTALIVSIRDRPAGKAQGPAAFSDTVRACFAALAAGL